MRAIVAISGKQRAGKNTAADFLYRLLEQHGFREVAFVDMLKEAVSSFYGITRFELDALKNSNPEYRTAIIEFAKRFKEDDPGVFIRKTLEIQGNLIITDMRYNAEAQAVLNDTPHSFLVRVDCPRSLRASRGVLSNEEDLSETDLDSYEDFDYILANWSTLDQLRGQCELVAEGVIDYIKEHPNPALT